MKNEILDDIFKDDFRNQLKPNEKVIWEGRPYLGFKDKFSMGIRWIIFGLFLLYSLFKNPNEIWIPFYIIIFSVSSWLGLFNLKKIRYLLTNQRILFQLWEKTDTHFWTRKKKIFRSIPLEEIKNIHIEKNDSTNGAILIRTKKPKQFSFQSKNLKTGETRYQPSLDLLEDVDEIAELIKIEMQKRLS